MFFATSPLIPLILGIIVFAIVLCCPPYRVLHQQGTDIQPCTGYTYTGSIPAPSVIAGNALIQPQYEVELGFMLFWTVLSIAKTIAWRRNKPRLAASVVPFICIWFALAGASGIIATSVSLSPRHQVVVCNTDAD